MSNFRAGFSDYEIGILKKYSDGRVIDPKDEDIVNEFADVGFMHIGVSLSEQKPTASTLYIGRLIAGEKSLMLRRE